MGGGGPGIGVTEKVGNDPLGNVASFGETELSSPLEEVSYSVPNFEN